MELIRQLTGPIVICILAALLDAGLRPWWMPWTGWLAIFLAIVGAFLWVSGTSIPNNPVTRQLFGEQGNVSSELRLLMAIFGAVCWLFALGLILWPIGQSMPEFPL